MRTAGAGTRRRAARGGAFALAAGGGIGFGVTVLFSRIVARDGLGPVTGLAVRFSLAGALLVGVLVATRRPLLPPPGERLAAFGLGAVVYAAEATCFFLALERGTAAAVALLFYSYPALVALVEVLLGDLALRPSLVLAGALAIGGAGVVAVGGGDVSITVGGVAFVLGSIVLFSCYALASRRLVPRADPLTAAAWTALGAAATLVVVGGVAGELRAPGDALGPLVGNGLATAAAFTLFFGAMARLGTSRTAIVMTLEAVSAVVLTAVFLGERVGRVEVAGGAAVLAGALLAGLVVPAPVVAEAEAAPP